MQLDNHTDACSGADCDREHCANLPENQNHPAWCRPLGGQHMTGCPFRRPLASEMRRHPALAMTSIRLVQPGDHVECIVVAVAPGVVTAEVVRGLYAPGTVITIRTKPQGE
jgi:hypothetical protein